MTDNFELSHEDILELITYARYCADLEGKYLALDAFCCQGACSAGLEDAGFIVVGVDLNPKMLAKYPGFRIQHDAVEFIRLYGHLFDVIWASPPCQDYSKTQRIVSNDFPRLIGPTRDALKAAGVPWVIENVEAASQGDNAEMRADLILCGQMFGIHTYRHRAFELGGWYFFGLQTGHERHTHPTVKMGRKLREGDFYHAVGNFQQVDYVRRDLNLPWMNRDGLRECSPRQYAQYIGVALQHFLDGEVCFDTQLTTPDCCPKSHYELRA